MKCSSCWERRHHECEGRVYGRSMMFPVDMTTLFDVGPCTCDHKEEAG